MKLQIDHVAVQVSDLEASIEFYKKIFGSKLLSKTVDKKHQESFAFLEMRGCNIELLQVLEKNNCSAAFARQELKKPFCPHLAVQSEDLDLLISELHRKNIPIVKGPLKIPGLVKWLYITDPDNNIIEYVEWLK